MDILKSTYLFLNTDNTAFIIASILAAAFALNVVLKRYKLIDSSALIKPLGFSFIFVCFSFLFLDTYGKDNLFSIEPVQQQTVGTQLQN
jgi:energy-coupling factor transporter transmembrane protein EcfT